MLLLLSDAATAECAAATAVLSVMLAVNYNNLLHASRDDVVAVEQIIAQMDSEAIPKDAMTYVPDALDSLSVGPF